MLDVSLSIISGYESCSTDYLLGKETTTPSATLGVDGRTSQQRRVLLDLVKLFRENPTIPQRPSF